VEKTHISSWWDCKIKEKTKKYLRLGGLQKESGEKLIYQVGHIISEVRHKKWRKTHT
jgi:hypothetical protein